MPGVDPLEPGDPQTIGRYTVLGRLGAGGMGRVYLARSPGGSRVAVKVVHAAYATDERFRARFRREVIAAGAVGGAFTAPVVDADPDAASPWLATAYLPGLSLQAAVGEHGPWPPPRTAALGAALAEALLSIHRAGIVHRDLKPSNVMLAADGPRVIDFGIARAADAVAITRTGAVLGTPGYLAPEQALGGETGPAGDVFALGGVLVFTATGEGPFGRGTVEEMLRRVVREPPRLDALHDPGLRALAAACLAKDPADRPTPADLLRELSAVSPDGPLPPPQVAAAIDRLAAAPLPVLPRAGRVPRRALLAAAGGGLGAVALAGTAAALAWTRSGPERPPADLSPTTALALPGRAAQPLWRFDAQRSVDSSPAVSGGVVSIGGDDGHLYGLDLAKGTRRWRYAASGEVRGTVAVAGGVAFTGSSDGAVHAVRVSDGRRVWRRSVGTDARVVAVLGDSVLVAASADDAGAVVRLAARDGAVRWKHPTSGMPDGPVAVVGGAVYVADGALYALDADGKASAVGAAPAALGASVVGDLLLVGVPAAGAGGPAVVALDARTRARRWSATTQAEVKTAAVRAGGVLCVADTSGTVYGIGTDGTIRWRRALSGAVAASPAAAGDTVVIGAGDQCVYGITAASGEIAWTCRTGDAIGASTAAVAGRTAVVGSHDGYVYALETHPGAS
ncbi:PQQ-binding-like beta-propeller repeat protein [Actinomadura atramentaria]|uniref:serine/threonine-protein kinase n=1 Tax=Actinomadura atramentaria TaxID=1990 RepID=UPI0003688E91|nr:serine/threonine-protein kinase [Actinomadura atramentaria]